MTVRSSDKAGISPTKGGAKQPVPACNSKRPPEPRPQSPGDYEVEQIIDHKISHGQYTFGVTWVGYPSSEMTYEPAKNLLGARKLLRRYLRGHGLMFLEDEKSGAVTIKKLDLASSIEQYVDRNPKSSDQELKNSTRVKDEPKINDWSIQLKVKQHRSRDNSESSPARNSNRIAKMPRYSRDSTDMKKIHRSDKHRNLQKDTDGDDDSQSGRPRLILFPDLKHLANEEERSRKESRRRNEKSMSSSSKGHQPSGSVVSPSDSEDDYDEYTVEDPKKLRRKSGFELGWVVDKIVGVVDTEKPLRYLIKWRDTNLLEPVASEILQQEEPNMLIAFLENHVVAKSKAEILD